ncbi:MAG: hypothetical protein EOO47_00085 [Flavobacterium sp.]|nr:MAG: hypothetical protein EOO47_00085 [Flavobacterium sp.]
MVLDAMQQQLTKEEFELFTTLAHHNTSVKKTKDKQIEITKLKIKIKKIKNKIMSQLTEQEQYDLLLTIEDKLLYYNKYGEVTLELSDFDVLKQLHKVYFNKFTNLNTTCSSCVKECLNVCISRYSALKKQFDKVVEPQAPAQVEAKMKVDVLTKEASKNKTKK